MHTAKGGRNHAIAGIQVLPAGIFSGAGITPFDFGSFSSRVIVACDQVVKNAARKINKKLFGVAAVALNIQGEHLVARNGKIFS